MSKRAEFSKTATVTTDTTIIERVPAGRAKDLVFEAYNASASNALTAFVLQVKYHSGGTYVTLLQTTGWDSVAGVLKSVVGTLKTLGTTTRGAARVDITGVYAYKISASSASAAVTVKGTEVS